MTSSDIPSKTSLSSERKTFKRFMQVELWRTPEIEDLYPVLCSIEVACRDINRLMRRVSTDNLDGLYSNNGNLVTTTSKEKNNYFLKNKNNNNTTNTNNTNTNTGAVKNIQGEDQKKLDVIANRILKTSLCCSQSVSIIVSEEDDEPCLCSNVIDNVAFSGDFAAVFDPLDGSSNIDSGLPTGSIFGIYRKRKFGATDAMSTVTQKGSDLLVAGYCLYSAASHIVLTLGTGLHMFTLDEYTGEYYLTKSNIKMPRSGPIYSFNDVNKNKWNDAGVDHFLTDLKDGKRHGFDPKPTQRYMGALVADAHNILLHGGIFGYPSATDKPNGKLRLLYEANPLALIFEEAGGRATDGRKRILDINVEEIHQRTPLYLGSVQQIRNLEKYINFFSDE